VTAIAVPLQLRREGTLRSRAARGDAAAFAAVYERHHQALYRYCRSILRHEEDAQDALQNTMAQAFAALQDESRDFELRPWLFRIAHNEAISILRRRRASTELEDVPDASGDLDDLLSDREELRMLQLDLADLPERQRAALVLRELNGLSHAEIGIVLELSTSAVKQSIFEARSALFTCREGREMACDDVRRMLSDGDGRMLRARGVRAHLRNCPDCRRFKADLEQRPRALHALAPPLPIGTAAALLAQLIGTGTAAKLLACLVVVGGGTTLAVEMREARQPTPAVAESVTKPAKEKPATVVPVVASTAKTAPSRPVAERKVTLKTRAQPARKPRAKTHRVKKHKAPVTRPAATPTPTLAKAEIETPAKAERPPKVKKAKKIKVEQPAKSEKPAKPQKPAKVQKPAKAEKQEAATLPVAAAPVETATAEPKTRETSEPHRQGDHEDDDD
jgi:RNA polymerase sigma factor (sigma-70 family)